MLQNYGRRRLVSLLLSAAVITSAVGWKHRSCSHSCTPIVLLLRAGEITEEDAALDAYIEELIASVETTDDEKAEVPAVSPEEKDDSFDEQKDEKPIAVVVPKSEPKKPKAKGASRKTTNKTSKNEKKKSLSKSTKKQKKSVKTKKKKPKIIVASAEVEEEPNAEEGTPEEVVENETASEDEILEEVALETKEKVSGAKETAKSSPKVEEQNSSDMARLRRRPPSPLHRFLLRQGLAGKVCTMLLVLSNEWIETYLPPVAHVLAWISLRLLPRQHHDTTHPLRRPATNVQSTAVSSRRTGQTGKQRRKLTKQADQAAMEQLKRAGDVTEAKYRHVSEEFLRRHGLGRYAKDSMSDVEDDKLKTKQPPEKIRLEGEEQEEDEDDDWILKALTEEKPILDEVTGDVAKISLDEDFFSGEAALGTDSQRRSSVAMAAVKKRKRKKKSSVGPRASDRDGGDGIFGRIRAATGVNSLVSRSLLGAYPGDAAPPEQAGSADGLIDLARRYGWGEWSDEENDFDEDLVVAPRKKNVGQRRKKQKRVSRSSTERGASSTGTIEISLSGGLERTNGTKKKSRRRKDVDGPPSSVRRVKGSSLLQSEKSFPKPEDNPTRRDLELPRKRNKFAKPLDRINEVKRRKKKRKTRRSTKGEDTAI